MRSARILRSVLSLSTIAAMPLVVLTVAAPLPTGAAFAAASMDAKELDFTPSELRLWKDPETGNHFWYFTYEVVNNTGKDQRFAPRIELLVDDGRIVRQGDGVPTRVNRDLKEFLGDALLEDQFEILGMVLQGKTHAKSGLVVFRADDLDPTELTVMVQGLSKETEKRQNPKTGETVTAKTILIATGARPFLPDQVGGIELADTSDEFFDWEVLWSAEGY
jgi:hypothetical protein